MCKDNGGSAFPCTTPLDAGGSSASGYPFPDSGMTLRDYFAAKAMQGFIASPQGKHPHHVSGNDYARDAYMVADAMLKARDE